VFDSQFEGKIAAANTTSCNPNFAITRCCISKWEKWQKQKPKSFRLKILHEKGGGGGVGASALTYLRQREIGSFLLCARARLGLQRGPGLWGTQNEVTLRYVFSYCRPDKRTKATIPRI
jgi:hypothetical protein